MGGLFEAAAAGDPRAVAEVQGIVRAFARSICRGGSLPGAPELDWEDVAQEALRKLLALGLRQYSGRGTERSYLFSVVKATLIEMGRSAKRRHARETAALPNGAPSPHDPSGSIDLAAILAALPGDCRNLIERAIFEDVPYADLAAEMGIAESSVRARLCRCLQRARAIASGEETRR
jgi:RNA polymerase sigma factor (sigma-70 family)